MIRETEILYNILRITCLHYPRRVPKNGPRSPSVAIILLARLIHWNTAISLKTGLLLNNIKIHIVSNRKHITSLLKNQPANSLEGSHLYLLWQPHETHNYAVWAQCRILVLSRVRGSVTNNNGFRIGRLDLLALLLQSLLIKTNYNSSQPMTAEDSLHSLLD
jgi:hypothetical protein